MPQMFGRRNMNLTEAGVRIREARKKAKLTQGQLAQRLGMGRSTISLIENGLIPEIGLRKYAALCDRLGLTIAVMPLPKLPTWEATLEQTRLEQEGDYAATAQIMAESTQPRPHRRHA